MAFDFDRHWRLMVGGSALAGVATVLALHVASGRDGEPVPAVTEFAQEAGELAVESEPLPMDEIAVGETMPAPDVAIEEVDRPFREYSSENQFGNWKDRYGDCYYAIGHTPQEMAENLEGKRGVRLKNYEWFKDGLIVNFKNGERIAVWPKLIDCKDPPYDPFEEQREQAQDSSR